MEELAIPNENTVLLSDVSGMPAPYQAVIQDRHDAASELKAESRE